jgi:hypothetical protein
VGSFPEHLLQGLLLFLGQLDRPFLRSHGSSLLTNLWRDDTTKEQLDKAVV